MTQNPRKFLQHLAWFARQFSDRKLQPKNLHDPQRITT